MSKNLIDMLEQMITTADVNYIESPDHKEVAVEMSFEYKLNFNLETQVWNSSKDMKPFVEHFAKKHFLEHILNPPKEQLKLMLHFMNNVDYDVCEDIAKEMLTGLTLEILPLMFVKEQKFGFDVVADIMNQINNKEHKL